ncbi:S1 family peptidase [Streptomyces sp. NBC_01498]|uniref:S1 family peptidase n=1 Tax=Streptomyces sp. NBC_01498 TaxID=2975870 RepID=UPI002E7B473F|nr:S1 family peptidase [Streptomyces sp. NBC_01498]WTL23320.1 S1 family peptidase [Streptomyces sp. NBC_01498]
MSPYGTERPFRRPTRRPFRGSIRTAASAVAALTLLLGLSAATGSAAYAKEPTTRAAAPAATSAPANAKAVTVRGGNVLYHSSGVRCTIGFNASGAVGRVGLLPKVCAQIGGNWYADSARTVLVATSTGVLLPTDNYDLGIVRYVSSTTVNPVGEVSLLGAGTLDITGAASPAVGQRLCHVGVTSGVRCGSVTGVNLTVNFPQGTVYGLFRSNICSEPGDLGGPAYSGSVALGVIVASSGNCTSGGATYYQPVLPWLSTYGVTVY